MSTVAVPLADRTPPSSAVLARRLPAALFHASIPLARDAIAGGLVVFAQRLEAEGAGSRCLPLAVGEIAAQFGAGHAGPGPIGSRRRTAADGQDRRDAKRRRADRRSAFSQSSPTHAPHASIQSRLSGHDRQALAPALGLHHLACEPFNEFQSFP